MSLRKHHLGYITLCANNRILLEDEQNKLISARRTQLLGFCPQLIRLPTCKLVTGIEGVAANIRLHYFLLERRKPHALIFDELGDPKVVARDFYYHDVLAAVAALQNIHSQIALAMNPNIHVASTAPSVDKRDLNAIRRAIRKYGGQQIELPGMNEQTILIPIPPKTIPVGTQITISAKVIETSCGEATLDDILLVANGLEVASPELVDEISMHRAIDGPQSEFNNLLLRAQDHHIRIRLDVVVLRQWSDAEPLALRLVTAYEFQAPPPVNTDIA
jgi:hypothetical protein